MSRDAKKAPDSQADATHAPVFIAHHPDFESAPTMATCIAEGLLPSRSGDAANDSMKCGCET